MEAIITCTTELVEGGCNACPVVPATTYAIRFDGVATPMDELEVEALIMAVVLKNGFRQELVLDFDEEATLYKKENQVVTLTDFYGSLTYSNGVNQFTLKNNQATQAALFEQVNQVLDSIFQLEPVTFIVEEVEA